MITDANQPPADSSMEAEIAGVFGFDSAPTAAPAAVEPAEGVAAPSPSAEPAAPVAPAAEPAPAVQEPAPAAPAAPLPPLAAPAPAPAAPAPAPAAPAAPPSAADLELQSLRAQVQALTLAAQQPPAPAAPAAPAAAATGDPAADVPAYSLSIPDELGNAIFSEDPVQAKAGMTHLVNSLAQHIHKTVRTEFLQTLQQRDQQVQQQDNEAQQTAHIQQMQQDYYGKYPDHNNPVIKQIVSLEAGKIATEFPGLPWGDSYRDALGARVNAAIAALANPAAPAAPVPTPAPVTPPARPAAFAPNGARPAPAPDGTASEQDIISTTFGEGWS